MPCQTVCSCSSAKPVELAELGGRCGHMPLWPHALPHALPHAAALLCDLQDDEKARSMGDYVREKVGDVVETVKGKVGAGESETGFPWVDRACLPVIGRRPVRTRVCVCLTEHGVWMVGLDHGLGVGVLWQVAGGRHKIRRFNLQLVCMAG